MHTKKEMTEMLQWSCITVSESTLVDMLKQALENYPDDPTHPVKFGLYKVLISPKSEAYVVVDLFRKNGGKWVCIELSEKENKHYIDAISIHSWSCYLEQKNL